MSTGVELVFRGVVVVGGPHVSNEADIIYLFGEVGPPIGDFDPALAMFAKIDLHGVDGWVHIPHVDFFCWDRAEAFFV